MRYTHEIHRYNPHTDKIGRLLRVIETKKAFKQFLVKHFSSNGCRIIFRLVGSPNTAWYVPFPYTNRLGNSAVAFRRWEKTR